MFQMKSETPIASATPCNPKPGKVIWTPEEDAILKSLVETKGTASWTAIAASLADRSGKQCRERWHNHLEQGIKKGDWSKEEDKIILSMQKVIGNQWAKITKLLPGRTDNSVKNRYHVAVRQVPVGEAASRAIPEAVLIEARKVDDPDIHKAIEKYCVEVQAQCQSPVLAEDPAPATATAAVSSRSSSSRITATGAGEGGSQATIVTATATAVPQWPIQYLENQQSASSVFPLNSGLPLPLQLQLQQQQQQQTAGVAAVAPTVGAAEAHALWEEASDADSLLMDLELVSFDGDTDYLDAGGPDDDQEEESGCAALWHPSTGAGGDQHAAYREKREKTAAQRCLNLEIDPCCFSNFDFGFLLKTEAPVPIPQPPAIALQQQQQQQQQVPQPPVQPVFLQHPQAMPFQNPMQQHAATAAASAQEVFYQQHQHQQQYAAYVQQQQQHAAFMAKQQQLYEQTQPQFIPCSHPQPQPQQKGSDNHWWQAFRR